MKVIDTIITQKRKTNEAVLFVKYFGKDFRISDSLGS